MAHDGEIYVVDVQVGHCGCKDHEFRGDELVCKHQCAAAIRHCYRDVRNTELVARVLRHARTSGCPHGYAGCPGPTGPGLPCEDCIRSVGAGHWVVWCRVTNHDDWLATDANANVDTGEGVATDGGDQTRIGAAAEPAEGDLPAVEYTGEHRAECAGCGRDGPLTPDDEPVILHTWECPRGDDLAEYADDSTETAETGDDDTDAGGGLGTVTGWAGSAAPDTESGEVDEDPL